MCRERVHALVTICVFGCVFARRSVALRAHKHTHARAHACLLACSGRLLDSEEDEQKDVDKKAQGTYGMYASVCVCVCVRARARCV